MKWIIWVRLAVELMKLLQAKQAGEKLDMKDIENSLMESGVKPKDIVDIEALLPDVFNLIKDVEKLFKK
jgi:hypothetical protein